MTINLHWWGWDHTPGPSRHRAVPAIPTSLPHRAPVPVLAGTAFMFSSYYKHTNMQHIHSCRHPCTWALVARWIWNCITVTPWLNSQSVLCRSMSVWPLTPQHWPGLLWPRRRECEKQTQGELLQTPCKFHQNSRQAETCPNIIINLQLSAG